MADGHLAARQTTSRNVFHIAKLLSDAVEYGGCGSGIAAVVAPHHHGVVGVGPHHDDAATTLAERKHIAAVLKQHGALARHVESQLLVGLAGHNAHGNLSPINETVGVEIAQFEACNEQSAQTGVEFGLTYLASLNGLWQLFVVGTALHVGARPHGFGRSRGRIGRNTVAVFHPEVGDGSAVAGDESLKSPFVAQNLALIAVVAAARFTVDALIGAHHFGHIALLHQRLEGRKIGFPKVALGQLLDVERVAVPLRTAVHGKVFGASQEFAVATVGRTLQSAHHSQSHSLGEIGVFAVGFLSASPPWVTEYIYIWSPKRQTLISLRFALAFGFAVLCPRLVAHSSKYLFEQSVVPR